MALKAKIEADEYDALTPLEKSVYLPAGQDEDGNDLDGYVADVGGLIKYADEMQKHKNRAIASKTAQNTKMDELQSEIDRLTEIAEGAGGGDGNGSGGNGSGGNFEELYKTAKAKIKTLEDDLRTTKEGFIEEKKATTAQSKIDALTSELCGGSNPLMLNYLKGRIGAIVGEDGAVELVIKDEAGKDTANTIDDLKKEIAANDYLKPILKIKQSAGGGSGGAGGAGGGGDVWAEAFDPKKPNHAKMRELQLEDPAKFAIYHKKYLQELGA